LIFSEVMDLEWGPLTLVSTTEEQFGRNSSGSGPGSREYRLGGSVALTMRHPLSSKAGINGRYTSLEN
jgi:hypothetical protein